MSAHLILITLGPVQEFIAQARRTRDLWFGSHLLSELGRAAARALLHQGARLIFPALDRADPELEPCLGPVRADGKVPLSVPNKLIAAVPAGLDPESLACQVRQEIFRYWREEIAEPVRQRCAELLAPGTGDVWDEQIATALEFYATWGPLQDYVATRVALEQTIAARKGLRDFQRWRHLRGAVPKSSLDGARETVLLPPEKRDKRLARKYRIADGEQLDAVGLVKRAGGEPEQFVPIINIALSSWLKLARERVKREFEALLEGCRELEIPRVVRKGLPCAEVFPFDASVVLESRWRPLFQELGIGDDPVTWGRECVKPLLEKLSVPYPYVACLVADGDRIGRYLGTLGDPEQHRAFSMALSQFAEEARSIVEQEHSGVLIYSGGDDALAFLPLPEVLACADRLRRAFADCVARAPAAASAAELPTLSVGVGIGHVMEGMGDLLALGREAEANAKNDRNALSVIVDKRSGGRRCWRATWDRNPVEQLNRSILLLEERLSTRKVFEIAMLLRRLPDGPIAEAKWSEVLRREVERALARVGEGSLTPNEVDLAFEARASYQQLRQHVSAWVDRVLIAREIARSVPRLRPAIEEVAV